MASVYASYEALGGEIIELEHQIGSGVVFVEVERGADYAQVTIPADEFWAMIDEFRAKVQAIKDST